MASRPRSGVLSSSAGSPAPGSRTSGNLSPAGGSPVVASRLNKDSGKFDMLMKVILIGDSGVGKSCLLMRFSEDTFHQSDINTVGIDFKIKSMVLDDKIVKLQIYQGKKDFAQSQRHIIEGHKVLC